MDLDPEEDEVEGPTRPQNGDDRGRQQTITFTQTLYKKNDFGALASFPAFPLAFLTGDLGPSVPFDDASPSLMPPAPAPPLPAAKRSMMDPLCCLSTACLASSMHSG